MRSGIRSYLDYDETRTRSVRRSEVDVVLVVRNIEALDGSASCRGQAEGSEESTLHFGDS